MKDLKGLQKAKAEDLIRAKKTTQESPYGEFRYGPTLDGEYLRGAPAVLLQLEPYWDVPRIVSHSRADGLLFTPPWIRDKPFPG